MFRNNLKNTSIMRTREIIDEVWEGHFGWAIKKDKVGELEKLLEIGTFDY